MVDTGDVPYVVDVIRPVGDGGLDLRIVRAPCRQARRDRGRIAAPQRLQPRFFPGINRGNGWRSQYEGRRYRPYNGISRYGIAGRLVENDPGGKQVGGSKSNAYFHGYKHGLAHRYHDVKRDRARTPEGDKSGPRFTVEVQSAIANARTSSEIKLTAGRLDVPEQARGNQLRALATAQVYFNRPHEYSRFARRVWGRADGKYEMGSLFSPYWQARLVETSLLTKSELAAVP